MEITKQNARLAGILYLLVTIFGIFPEFFVRSRFIIPGDAGATAANIVGNELLFRFGLVSDILCQTSHFFLVIVLYMMFKPVNRTASLTMLSCVLVSVSITFLNLLNHFAAIFVLNTDYLKVFSTQQLQALSLLFLDLHKKGYAIAGVFFGLWLYPLGYLVWKSAYFPRIIGVLLMIGCFGYILDFFRTFLFPDYQLISNVGLTMAVVGELSLVLYLLIKGIKTEVISCL